LVHKIDSVRVLTAATGNSTTITLGARFSDQFMTPADAGAIDGRIYTWRIDDVIGGSPAWEIVKGVYTASGTTAARTTVLAARSGGTLSTTRLLLSGTAQVRIIEAAEDMDGVRGTRVVTGTSDVLSNNDLGYVVTYSNASAIAVSLAQAAVSNLFMDGWSTWVQNLGAGTVTITPATSTINTAATLPLATGMGAFIWSDGTNYHFYYVPVSKPLLASNNLADVASAAAARTSLGLATIANSGSASDLSTGTLPLARRGYTFPDVILEEQFTLGINGGTFTAGSFVTRTLNTFVRNVGSIASVSGGQVTLPAGTWAFKWSAPAFDVGNHQTILKNITSGITQGIGTSEDASGTTNTTSSVGSAVVAVASSTVFALQHQCGTTRATNGFGVGAGFATEVFSRLEITQLA
jgi:hypothetical protein